jgi:CHAD domain-containing protein
VEPAFPAAEALLGALEPLQEVLGDLHDVDVRIERLRDLAVRGDRAERKAARKLLDPLEAERKKRSRALAGALEELRVGPVREAAKGLKAGEPKRTSQRARKRGRQRARKRGRQRARKRGRQRTPKRGQGRARG